VPWFKTHQRLIDAATLPGPGARVDQVRVAAQTLQTQGYVAVGLDHFALPHDSLAQAQASGRLRRNFQGYTTDEADHLIGLGASAIGRLPQGFVQNAVDIGGYSRAVEKGKLATVKGVALTPDDRLRGGIIERLMCDLAVDLGSFKSEDGLDVIESFAPELDELGPLVSADIARVERGRVSVTERGRPFVRLVAAVFDAYLPQNRSRHSIAV
jgi:oxygen-independent coproporphyrinogen-3 oxidase